MVIGLISKGGKGCLLNLTKVLEAESKNIKVQFKGRVSDDVAIDMFDMCTICLLYTSPSPRDAHESRMPSSA